MFWHYSFILIGYPCSIGVQKYKCINENKVIVNTTLLEYQVLFYFLFLRLEYSIMLQSFNPLRLEKKSHVVQS